MHHLHIQPGVALKNCVERAFDFRVEMADENEGRWNVSGKALQQGVERFHAAGGGADSDDEKWPGGLAQGGLPIFTVDGTFRRR
jgi:hypothetical protein